MKRYIMKIVKLILPIALQELDIIPSGNSEEMEDLRKQISSLKGRVTKLEKVE